MVRDLIRRKHKAVLNKRKNKHLVEMLRKDPVLSFLHTVHDRLPNLFVSSNGTRIITYSRASDGLPELRQFYGDEWSIAFLLFGSPAQIKDMIERADGNIDIILKLENDDTRCVCYDPVKQEAI
jgi:hypothetical protein